MDSETKKKIIGLVLTAVISLVVGIAGTFGVQVLTACTSTGSANWDIQTTVPFSE